MKLLTSLALAATLLASQTPALADRGPAFDRGPSHWGTQRYHDRHHDRHHHRHARRHDHWVGPAAVVALGGLALGAIAYQHANPAPVVIVNPPPRSTNTWYYCHSAGQYYPYTPVCPEGWQAVPAR